LQSTGNLPESVTPLIINRMKFRYVVEVAKPSKNFHIEQ